MPDSDDVATLTVDLRELFEKDLVEIRIDGALACVAEDVSTRLQTGLARSLRVPVPARPCEVEVALPKRGLRQTVSCDSASTPHLGVELAPDGLRLLLREEPFGYL